MNKAQELRNLSRKACQDNSWYGRIIEDADIAAREGCLSLEVKLPADSKERKMIINMLKSEGFSVSEFDPYTHRSTIRW